MVIFLGTLIYRFHTKGSNGDFEFKRFQNKLEAEKLQKLAQLSAPKE